MVPVTFFNDPLANSSTGSQIAVNNDSETGVCLKQCVNTSKSDHFFHLLAIMKERLFSFYCS